VSLSLKPIPSLLVKVDVNGNKKHVTLYRNGKYIIAGVKSDEELQLILTRCCRKPGRG